MKTAEAEAGENLLDVLRRDGVFLEAACSGRGICGKCLVQILEGNTAVSRQERDILTDGQLAEGYRLACQVVVSQDMTVSVPDGKAEIQVLGIGEERVDAVSSAGCEKAGGEAKSDAVSGMECEQAECEGKQAECGGKQAECEGKQAECEGKRAECGGKQADADFDDKEKQTVSSGGEKKQLCVQKMDGCIAVDIGSTTLAAVLTDLSGKILAQAAAVNSQRSYGADVISRIQAANEGRGRQLKECICRDLESLFCRLIRKLEGNVRILRIAAAGNTTMLHLLRGYSCEGLGRFPFEPVNLGLECLDYRELFADIEQCRFAKVYLLPGMSVFVGADITAGLYSSGFWQTPEIETAFFLDLGTNGEMAFGNGGGFVTASAPAGPAFEGGGLSCGMPSVPGAVSNVSYLYHRVRIQTVGQKKPCGICGTGALEAAAALLKEGLMDAQGLLCPALFETGLVLARREDGSNICLTQADIRKIQMAKAAVRAGIDILLKKYREVYRSRAAGEDAPFLSGTGEENGQIPGKIYLAGGFGYYLSAETAIAVGLFPKEWKDRIVLCGNTCLKGAAAFLSDEECAGEMEEICRRNDSVRLEGERDFEEIYVRNMGFEREE